jgi:hypothetical protein
MTNGSGVMITVSWWVLLKILFWTNLDLKPTSNGEQEEP